MEEVYAELQKMTRHQLMEICGRRYGSKLDLLALSLHANRPAKKASSCLAAGMVSDDGPSASGSKASPGTPCAVSPATPSRKLKTANQPSPSTKDSLEQCELEDQLPDSVVYNKRGKNMTSS